MGCLRRRNEKLYLRILFTDLKIRSVVQILKTRSDAPQGIHKRRVTYGNSIPTRPQLESRQGRDGRAFMLAVLAIDEDTRSPASTFLTTACTA